MTTQRASRIPPSDPDALESRFFVDVWQQYERSFLCRWTWELREGQMDNAIRVTDGGITTTGEAMTRAGARWAARHAKRKILKVRELDSRTRREPI